MPYVVLKSKVLGYFHVFTFFAVRVSPIFLVWRNTFFGVFLQNLQKIQKTTKKNQYLSEKGSDGGRARERQG
jgi:hypothetical protein